MKYSNFTVSKNSANPWCVNYGILKFILPYISSYNYKRTYIMKRRANFLLTILIVLLASNLVFQSCQKENYLPTDALSDSTQVLTRERTLDSLDFYKNVVARCVAKGLGNTDFKTFFRRVAARNEGNQNGFSLWRYRDSTIYGQVTLARFLSMQASQLGYSYNSDFFRGHLVRYIPNLSIGVSLWTNTLVSDYTFPSSLKVASLPTNYYEDVVNAGVSTLYSQSMLSSVSDVDNANYDFVYVDENPYYELFKTSNNKSLKGDKTVPEMHALPANATFDAAFAADALGSNYKFRLPGEENIQGVNCYLVDKSKVMDFYGKGDSNSSTAPSGGPCSGMCERDMLTGYERVRFVYMVNGSDLKKKFGCKPSHNKCTFAITQYRYTPNPNSSSAIADQQTKVVSLWEKGLRNGEWVWWNDEDNKYTIWDFCSGGLGDQMFYGVVGKNPKAGTESTFSIGLPSASIKFKLAGFEVSLPISPSVNFTKKKTNQDFDFGQTETVYYCDPCTANGGAGTTYSTGSVRLRVREQ